MTLTPRVVVVNRRTELEELLDRHGTRGQTEFFLRSRGRNLAEVQQRHDTVVDALRAVSGAIPTEWRRGTVERADLDRFLFDPEDVIVVVGQDGLVANVAKYLDGQPLIGVDAEPGRNPGLLVPHMHGEVPRLLASAVDGTARILARTMVAARTDDGQELSALNEVYVGHASHQSSRWVLTAPDGRVERQSSSGLLVGTGTGATGWLRSAAQERDSELVLPAAEDAALAWFVREAWPSPFTGTSATEGVFDAGAELSLTVENDALVVFGDGLEADRLTASWGQQVTVTVAGRVLRCVA